MYENQNETETENVEHIWKDMLLENTGKHFLDSGGAYGRNWERNQNRDLENEHPLTLEIWHNSGHPSGIPESDTYEFVFSLKTYFWGKAFLERDSKCIRFESLLDEHLENNSYLKAMRKTAEQLQKEGEIYDYDSFNSYNWENILDQVLQGTNLSTNTRSYPAYVLLQIHQGCDVRGGYTLPRCFFWADYAYAIMAMHDISARCLRCGQLWYSDDAGYHFYADGSTAGETLTNDSKFKPWNIEVDMGDNHYCDGDDAPVTHNDCDGGEIVFFPSLEF